MEGTVSYIHLREKAWLHEYVWSDPRHQLSWSALSQAPISVSPPGCWYTYTLRCGKHKSGLHLKHSSLFLSFHFDLFDQIHPHILVHTALTYKNCWCYTIHCPPSLGAGTILLLGRNFHKIFCVQFSIVPCQSVNQAQHISKLYPQQRRKSRLFSVLFRCRKYRRRFHP